MQTPIYRLNHLQSLNNLYIKRDDLYPFSFGGNKARKAELFWKDIENKGADYIVTYGSSSSNHCRVIANLAAMNNIPCMIISPIQKSEETFNLDMMNLFGAEIVQTSVENVKNKIDSVLKELKKDGYDPYFIMGGGHGNIGTQAYVNVYEEIREYERKTHLKFDFIFHASGTGTTQAGLVCGQILNKEMGRRIIGISIARKNPYGRDIVVQSVKDYLASVQKEDEFNEKLIEFIDDYTGDGYGVSNERIFKELQHVLIQEGIPLDMTYTGKAFAGMCDFVEKNKIKKKNILFIHTGGGPLFFDYLYKEFRNKD